MLEIIDLLDVGDLMGFLEEKEIVPSVDSKGPSSAESWEEADLANAFADAEILPGDKPLTIIEVGALLYVRSKCEVAMITLSFPHWSLDQRQHGNRLGVRTADGRRSTTIGTRGGGWRR